MPIHALRGKPIRPSGSPYTIYLVWFLAAFLVVTPSLAQQSGPKLAVFPFKGTSLGTFSDVAERIADMLMTNLGESDSIRIVERTQIDRAIKNFRIESSRLFDPETTQQVGTWVGATHVLLGSIVAIQDQLRIDVRIVNVKSGELERSAKVEGGTIELFKLVNELSSKILSAFTGETKSFREAPRTILDREFTIAPPGNLFDISVGPFELYLNQDPPFQICYLYVIRPRTPGYRGPEYVQAVLLGLRTRVQGRGCEAPLLKSEGSGFALDPGSVFGPSQRYQNQIVDIGGVNYNAEMELLELRDFPGDAVLAGSRRLVYAKFRIKLTRT